MNLISKLNYWRNWNYSCNTSPHNPATRNVFVFRNNQIVVLNTGIKSATIKGCMEMTPRNANQAASTPTTDATNSLGNFAAGQ
ncbi:unnamed protein product [Hymenolepis diminuta]|uniref:Uncharacterized protein n=1 Tax=Hymenolepis diminuta TaxID=6216 RepID=A0A564YCK2_HYMDI|nr:unnamed protein product [Hymenolepis diminuta]